MTSETMTRNAPATPASRTLLKCSVRLARTAYDEAGAVAELIDITCDSNGKVSKLVDLQDVKETLPLHRWEPGDP